jgi:hypothetical protein
VFTVLVLDVVGCCPLSACSVLFVVGVVPEVLVDVALSVLLVVVPQGSVGLEGGVFFPQGSVALEGGVTKLLPRRLTGRPALSPGLTWSNLQGLNLHVPFHQKFLHTFLPGSGPPEGLVSQSLHGLVTESEYNYYK